MLRIIKKILIVMILMQIIFLPIPNALGFDEIVEQGDKFIEAGKDNQTTVLKDKDGKPVQDEYGKDIKVRVLDREKLKETVEKVYNILFAIGVAISVGAGAIIGIKFMVGSVEEQAKVKEMLAPYVIGCIVVFGGFGIWKIIMKLAGSMFI